MSYFDNSANKGFNKFKKKTKKCQMEICDPTPSGRLALMVLAKVSPRQLCIRVRADIQLSKHKNKRGFSPANTQCKVKGKDKDKSNRGFSLRLSGKYSMQRTQSLISNRCIRPLSYSTTSQQLVGFEEVRFPNCQ